jgi:hypothetical protein
MRTQSPFLNCIPGVYARHGFHGRSTNRISKGGEPEQILSSRRRIGTISINFGGKPQGMESEVLHPQGH